MKKKTTEEFIADARKVHGNKYDYSKTVYVNSRTKVCVTCMIHGDFLQNANDHVRGAGCPKCGAKSTWDNRGRMTTDDFVIRCNNIHGNRYDYSKTVYISNKKKVIVTCKKHGDFKMTPNSHLLGCGCPLCGKENMRYLRRKTQDDFIEQAKRKHGNKYDYSLVEYVNSSKKIKIICPTHGVFEQEANTHLSGGGCPKCKSDKLSLLFRGNTESFIEQAKIVHGDLYGYEKVKYVNNKENIEIVCHKHGSFYQTPNSHLRGAGCPMCASSRGEQAISIYLASHNIPYIRQYVIRNESLFCENKIMKIDFCVPSYNSFIEFNGEQHYEPNDHFGGEKDFIRRQERDFALKQYCQVHQIKLIVISYTDIKKIPNILTRVLKGKRT